jgi:5-methylcytosine-specific restriction endonuclease McrA
MARDLEPTWHGERVSWQKLKSLVHERDDGICSVCGWVPDYYELGHIVDRCAGGDDSDENVAIMCGLCNMLKPVHDTREEFLQWLKKGHWIYSMKRSIAMRETWLEVYREQREHAHSNGST